MLLSTLGKKGVLWVLCAFPLAGAPNVSEILKNINHYATLSPEKKETALNELSDAEWRKFSPDEKSEIASASYEASHQLIGRNPDGKLKAVKEAGGKQILKLAGDHLSGIAVEKTPAHPRAGELYGEIPENAPRIEETITINPAMIFWHSTGLYLAPGEIAELIFPESWVDKGLKVQISGHRDHIPVKNDLRRLPRSPARSFPVNQVKVKVASAFGGAIYIDTGNQPRNEEAFEVTISNALRAPYFVLGKTELSDWKDFLKNAPAPYAEFVSDRIAFSFPSAWIRDLEDPTALMAYWDRVVELHDELGGLENVRSGPERVNVDVQISVGLFHAGYPAQGPQDKCQGIVDLKALKTTANWGWFHELGHESQRRPDKAWSWNNPYTFDNSVEATVNLFTTHALDRLKIKKRGGWSWTADAEKVNERAHKALSSQKRYPDMSPAEKLAMYLLLRDEFGWKAIQNVLSSYSQDQDTKPENLPKNNQDKRDAFLIRMSQETKRNLTPFLQDIWGIEMSPAAVEKVKHLPSWMPKGFEAKTRR